MAQVILENVCKVYSAEKGREVTAVQDASLTVDSEEFMVFVGPSGCGKSTTLRMIAGLEAISRGNIYIDGKRVNDVAPKDRDIAMVFQNYALYPHMTVYKNMAFGLQLRKLPANEIKRRVADAAQILGFTDEMLERRPKTLSGGQRQRVALGRAIVRKPKVFLFDEPLSNLDAKMRAQTRTELCKLHSRLATTMIYVTHDQIEAMTMGDRICLMKDGRIQQVAEPLEIYNRPTNMFVAAFIGSPPMNFFEGTILRQKDHLIFVEAQKVSPNKPFCLQIPEQHACKLLPWIDRKLFLGLRPEDLKTREASLSSDPGQTFRATLDISELMGSESHLHLHTDNHSLIVRSEPRIEAPGDTIIELVADMKKAHFFESVDPAPFTTPAKELSLESWQAACRLIV
jgi:multiple sugar transport system ATP-binding protein